MDDPVVEGPSFKRGAAQVGTLDPAKHDKLQGTVPLSSGRPRSTQEQRDALRRAEDGEQMEFERGKALTALTRLTGELNAARRANEADRVEALSAQRNALALEIKIRFW